MNKITELKQAAGLYTDTSGRWANADAVDKLVELIVKECILTIQMGITRDGRDTEKYLRSMKHINQIREHFGVKE